MHLTRPYRPQNAKGKGRGEIGERGGSHRGEKRGRGRLGDGGPCGGEEEREKRRKFFLFLFSFPNKFSKLIFKLNLNSIQILVKANHYKSKCTAA